MAFVITKPCIETKDAACVVVCPCDVIHPTPKEPDFHTVDQLFIHPVECIDCGLCVAECPVQAIFQDTDVPPDMTSYMAKNADYFLQRDQPTHNKR